MQENKFEHEVRRRLDELSLTPSEPVWQNVEAAIKKKRERRLVFWLLPLLLVTGSLVWWQLGSWETKKVALQQPATPNVPPQSFSKPHAAPVDSETGTTNAAATDPFHSQPTVPPVIQGVKVPVATKNGILNKLATKDLEKRERTTFEKALTTKGNNESSAARKNAIKNSTAKPLIASSAVVETNGVKTSGTITNPTPATAAKDTLQKTELHKTADSAKAPTPAQPAKSNSQKRALQWTIVSRIGSSNTIEPLLNGTGMKAAYNDPNFNFSAGGPSTPGTNQDSINALPSSPSKGLHYTVGALVKKGVGKRSYVVAGLQFSYYSNHLTVGTSLPADSLSQFTSRNALQSPNVFRTTGAEHRFTNRFYFIELPIGFEYGLLKKLPLHVQHGIVISQLLESRLLQYDEMSHAYYQSKEGLRKTGISIYTAIDYTVWKNKTIALQAGPQVQYGLQRLLPNTSGSHLFSGGLSVNLSF